MSTHFNPSINQAVKKYWNLSLIFIAVLMIDTGRFEVSAQNSIQNVPRFGVVEESFIHAGSYSNPYTEVDAAATFIAPGGAIKTVPLFWDGGDTWKMRFSPDEIGAWTWVIASDDIGLGGQSGSFDCVASNNKGGIRSNSADPYHFEYEDGSPFWWMGDTQWAAFASNESENLNRSAVFHYIDIRSEQGFNYIHSSLMTFPAANEGGTIFDDISDETLNPAYFREVDSRIRYMNSKGITSGIALAWSRSKPLPYSWSVFISDAARLRYARYVTARYSAYNEVISKLRKAVNLPRKPAIDL